MGFAENADGDKLPASFPVTVTAPWGAPPQTFTFFGGTTPPGGLWSGPGSLSAVAPDGEYTAGIHFKSFLGNITRARLGAVDIAGPTGEVVGVGSKEIEITRLALGPDVGQYTVNVEYELSEEPDADTTVVENTTPITVVDIEQTPFEQPLQVNVANEVVTIQRDENGVAIGEAKLRYTAEPAADYQPNVAQFYVSEDGVEKFFFTASGNLMAGESLLINRGVTLDPNKTYTSQVVFNGGSESAEVRSEEVEIPIRGLIIASVQGIDDAPDAEPTLRNASSGVIYVDLLNGFSCKSDPRLDLNLRQDASVSLVIDMDGNGTFGGSDYTVLDNVPMTRDQINQILIDFPANEEGRFPYELTVTNAAGQVEVNEGEISFRVRTDYSLPVGHANHAGVDLYNGNLSLSRTDISINGRGRPLEFTRSYSSSNTELGYMGVGWTHNTEMTLTDTGCGGISIRGGDAGGIRFLNEGNFSYRPTVGYHGTLERNGDNTWDFYSKNGTRYHFKRYPFNKIKQWSIEYVEDTNGNRMSFAYDLSNSGRLNLIQDASGRQLKLEYDIRGDAFRGDRLVKVEGLEYVMTYEYDEYARLSSATMTSGEETRTETYLWEGPGNGFGDVFTKRAAMSEIIDARGNSTLFDWEVGSKFVIPGVTPVRFLRSAFMLKRTQRDGGELEFVYGERQGATPPFITTVKSPTIASTSGNRSADTIYRMNAYGSPIEIESEAGTQEMYWKADDIVIEKSVDEEGRETNFTYDVNGNILTEEVVDGSKTFASVVNVWTTAMDGKIKNLLAERTDRNGNTTRFFYNEENGNLERIEPPVFDQKARRAVSNGEGFVDFEILNEATEFFTYDDRGDRKTATDRRGNLTSFDYDVFGYLKTKTDPFGQKMFQVFDQRGRLTEQTDEEGRTTTFEYDGLDRLVKQVDTEDGEKTFQYDLNDNKEEENDEEGRITRFTYDPENRVKSITDADTNTKFLDYDDNGNLTRETDFRGNEVAYRYDGVNRQVEITQACGSPASPGCVPRVTTRAYDGVGNVTLETRNGGWRAEFDYDGLNRQTAVRNTLRSGVQAETLREYDDHGNLTQITDALGRITDMSYDAMNRLVLTEEKDAGGALLRTTSRRYDADDNLIGTIDGNGNASGFVYDSLGRRAQELDELGITVLTRTFDFVGNVLFEADAFARSIGFTYDDLNRVISRTDQIGNTTTFEYDAVGNLLTETWPEVTDAEGGVVGQNVITRTYDVLNRQETESDLIGPITQQMTYDADGNLTSQTDARGFITEFDYNEFNEVIETRLATNAAADISQTLKTTYDGRGNVTSQTNGRNFTTTFEYDLFDRPIKTTDARSSEALMAYDDVGNKISETDFRGNETVFEYDDLNRMIKQTDPQANLHGTTTSAHARELSFTYDGNDNVLTATDKRGFVTTNEYDARDLLETTTRQGVLVLTREYDDVRNLVFETDANGNKSAFLYTDRYELRRETRPLLAITNYRYDELGNQIEIEDPEKRLTRFKYDLRRRQIGVINGESEETVFGYDLANNQVSRQRPEFNTWTSGYDALNRLEKVIDPNLGETTYTYDKANNLTSQQDARLNTTSFEYDELNRRTSITYPGGDQIQFTTYDENGNLLTMLDARGITTAFTYDTLNRQVHRTFTTPVDATLSRHIDSVTTTYDGNNNVIEIEENYSDTTQHVTTQRFDDFDRLEEVTDPYGRSQNYTYDLNGNREQLTDPDGITTAYTYDQLNRVEKVTNSSGITTYVYDNSSLLTTVEYPNGTRTEMVYDDALRTERITNTLGTSSVVSSFEYEYDDNGNRTRQIEQNGAGLETTTYVYDALDCLEIVNYPDNVTTYTYDPAYNRDTELVVDLGGTTLKDLDYIYDVRNQLTTIDDQLDPAQDVTYAFDGNGNQVSKSQAGTTTDFIFDARDNLRQVTTGGSTVGQFLYDDKGMRIEKLGDRGTERYTYDDLSVLTQSDETNATIAKYDYGPNRLLSLDHESEGTQFYLTDALGSVANLTRGDGGIQARYQYDAFGNYRQQVGTSFNRLGFTGHEVDTETGLIYFKARFYDPDTGRFLSHDAEEGAVANPPSLHRYLYVFQNPTVFVDPDGRVAETVVDVISIGVGVVSLKQNLDEGNTGAAIIDGVGIALDVVAAAVPFVPGGAGLGIKALRAGDELVGSAKTIEKTADAPRDVANASDNVSDIRNADVRVEDTKTPKNSKDETATDPNNSTSDPVQEVILDTNAVKNFETSKSLLKENEKPVVTKQVIKELEELRDRPDAPSFDQSTVDLAKSLDVVDDVETVDTVKLLRERQDQLRKPSQKIDGQEFPDRNKIQGLEGDATIGSTALETNRPIITNDNNLGDALESLGADVRRPNR